MPFHLSVRYQILASVRSGGRSAGRRLAALRKRTFGAPFVFSSFALKYPATAIVGSPVASVSISAAFTSVTVTSGDQNSSSSTTLARAGAAAPASKAAAAITSVILTAPILVAMFPSSDPPGHPLL